ncbi:zinc finger protein 862-like [Macrobrachium rosenbergii]|uniref:zinc finger protein 862-like n=1 Tax=Macrobrachium rosenbergii TaxID=79674 RepID=UPI0034D4CD6C
MPKKCNWSVYKKHYNPKWESEEPLRDWVKRVPGDETKARCRFCNAVIRAHHSDLMKHANTATHKSYIKARESNVTRFLVNTQQTKQADISQKVTDLKLSVTIACHASINSIDHIGEVIKECGKSCNCSKNTLRDLQLHRTKCSNLIKNVLGPEMKNQLITDIGSTPYSLIIDESTDITTNKQLCLVIRYYSQAKRSMISTFLGLVIARRNVSKCSELQALTDAICKFLGEVGLNIGQCLGLGTDGASVLCGTNNSVLTKLQEKNPSIIGVRCVCHSLQLACSKAVEAMPRSVDFLAHQTYNWFSFSSSRQTAYKDIYKAINNGTSPLKIMAPSGTRWLSIFQCVERILSQWDELKLHFQLAKSKEKCYTAEMLHQMYADPVNKLYLEFLKPILGEFNRVNKLFQGENVSCLKLFRTIKPAVIQRTENLTELNFQDETILLPSMETDLGALFFIQLDKSPINSNAKIEVRRRCTAFLREACMQVAKRLPNNLNMLKSMTLLSPKIATSAVKPKVTELPFIDTQFKGDLSSLEIEWKQVNLVDWGDAVSKDPIEFWGNIMEYEDSVGKRHSERLANFALKILCLPISNADVERVFSQVNLIKTDLRNRMGQDLLSAILYIRSAMRCHEGEEVKKCRCPNVLPSDKILQAVQSSSFYDHCE